MIKGVLNWRERLLVVVITIGLFFLLAWGVGRVTTRVVCGAWPTSLGKDYGILFRIFGVLGGDIESWVGTVGSCTLGNSALWGITIGLGIIVVAIVVVGMRRFQEYRLSPAYLRKSILSRREVVASRTEVKREMGPGTAVERGRKVRPETSKERGKKFAPADAAFKLGTSQGVDVWVSMEDAVLVIGPPRSGKGFGIITSQIVDAPGPVVTTSTRGDNMEATIYARSLKGPVYVVDPSQVTGRASTLSWSPIRGCEDGDTAKRRAEMLIEATGLGAGDSGHNQEFATKAVEVLQALLHAAAISGASMDDLYAWTKSPERARQAVDILASQSQLGWEIGLGNTLDAPAEQRRSEWFGVASALGPVDVPEVRALFQPDGDTPVFDPREFLLSNGTLYLVSPMKPSGKTAGVGVLLVMLLDAITEEAHKMAMQAPGGRLDPPLTLPLDEIANIFPWPMMPNWMAAGSGEGIQVWAVVQSRSQLRAGWGTEGAVTAWEAATRKIILGGGSSEADLKEAVALLDEQKHRSVNESWSGDRDDSFSEQESFRSGLSIAEMRRLPELMALVIAGRARAIVVDLIPWTKREFAHLIHASKNWHTKHPGSPDKQHPGQMFTQDTNIGK